MSADNVDPTELHVPAKSRVRQDPRTTPTRTVHEPSVRDANDLCALIAVYEWGDDRFVREVRAAVTAALLRSGAQVRDEGGDK